MIRKTGTVVTVKLTNIGEVSRDYVSARFPPSVSYVEVTDVFTGAREIGIEFEGITIDYDEIESLLRGIDYFSKLGAQVPPSSLQVFYKTSSGNFGMFYGGSLTIITTGRSQVRYKIHGLSELRTLIFQAKQKLDKIK